MKEFLEYLLKQVVTNPNALTITETKDQDVFVYTITAAPEDMGTIIGKEGRNINSLRNMAKVKAIRDDIRIRILVEDGEAESEPNVQDTPASDDAQN